MNKSHRIGNLEVPIIEVESCMRLAQYGKGEDVTCKCTSCAAKNQTPFQAKVALDKIHKKAIVTVREQKPLPNRDGSVSILCEYDSELGQRGWFTANGDKKVTSCHAFLLSHYMDAERKAMQALGYDFGTMVEELREEQAYDERHSEDGEES